jgi:hypothetical protein
MRKYFILTSVLALTACGGGSGGGYVQDEKITALQVPEYRVARDIKANKSVTSMANSVNNKVEMTAAVEQAVGSDLLADMANNLDGIASSIRHYSNREISNRKRNAASYSTNSTDKASVAYNFLEYGRRFRGFDANNQRKFLNEHPEHRSFVMGLGKLFCACDVSGLSDNQLLDLFTVSDNQNRFDNFYNQNHYKEILLDNVRFNMIGFNNSEPETGEMKFVVDGKTGVVTGIELLDGNDVVAYMPRNKDAKGNYLDTFKSVGYKYQIALNPESKPYITDSFDSKDISKKDLWAIIEQDLNKDTSCDESCVNAYLDAFNNNQGSWIEQVSSESFELQGETVGLHYSDFGYSTMIVETFDGKPATDSIPDNTVIYGGYKAKQIDPSLFADKTFDFRGKAIGAAAYYLDDSDDKDSKRIATADNAATLHFENGTETLTMPFEGYYTVTVNKTGNNATVNFSDYPSEAEAKFRFDKESGITTGGSDLVNVKINYYGDGSVPSEATGGVSYEEHNGGLKSFESAFGVARQ